MAEDRITETVTVPVSAERAFAAFVDDFANWWPGEYTWGPDTLESIAIEGREGGRCVETGPQRVILGGPRPRAPSDQRWSALRRTA